MACKMRPRIQTGRVGAACCNDQRCGCRVQQSMSLASAFSNEHSIRYMCTGHISHAHNHMTPMDGLTRVTATLCPTLIPGDSLSTDCRVIKGTLT